MIISELNVSDGEITEFAVQSDTATVVIKDWKEQIYTLTFKDIIGVEAYSPERVDLCHIKILTGSERVKNICTIVEADEEGIKEYSFISAWNDLPILVVFGETVEIK